jgi:hypothetical protein
MGESFTSLVLEIFKKCAGRSGCEVCREHMEEDCLFFPEMYRLHDLAEETGTPPSNRDLSSLVNLCTLCGLCPCQDIRILVLKAKAARAQDKKIPLSVKLLSDAQVAYFAGCSAGYLFPAVAKAAVGLLKQNKIQVFVPSQHCCGMPLIMEGNQPEAIKRIQANLENLGACMQEGYDIVCSCPTCGYFFKKLLLETAYYSDAFQKQSGADATVMKVPSGSKDQPFTTVPKNIYQKILLDNGYFSGIDPLQRIALSLKVKDMGEYLLSLQNSGKAAVTLRNPEQSLAYFAPCHQREQGIGPDHYHRLPVLPHAAAASVFPAGVSSARTADQAKQGEFVE